MIEVIYCKQLDRVPAKMWTKFDDLELGVKNQIDNMQNLPFAFHHVAIMPDCHSGYGMTVGGVMALDGVVSPYAVGSDIGCGMCTVKTSLKASQLDKEILKKIMGKIREVIPVGVGSKHDKEQDKSLMPNRTTKGFEYMNEDVLCQSYKVVHQEYSNALKSLGSLGSGNHFIEIQKDTEDNVWIMIHSGSRNLGNKVCDYYNKLAIELNKKWCSSVPPEWQLAFFPIDSAEGKDYMKEMQYCVDFALANRRLMMERIGYVLTDVCSSLFKPTQEEPFGGIFFKMDDMINIAHNYARFENHFGKNVIVHRKGATSAKVGEIGIIPGSQGSKSYIVRGLGNPESFMSCSHGAGRRLGRKAAINTLNLEEEIRKMDEQGIVHGIRTQEDLDEASGAYKSIDEVMANQKDLVEILVELQPLAVIKGD